MAKKRKAEESNPFLAELRAAQASLPRAPRVLDGSLADDARAELWNAVCEAGDALREKYAWACPDERALRAIVHFAPGGVVEVGAGRGYWAKLLRERGVNVDAFDRVKAASPWTEVGVGGPEVLLGGGEDARLLLLCYPDDFESDDAGGGEEEEEDEDDDDDDDEAPLSMSLAARCLDAYRGDVVVHIGELFGDTLSLAQAPWGRTTGGDFHAQLAAGWHCVLRLDLPRWPMHRDTLSVWRRTTVGARFGGDDEDDDEADAWADIPEEERILSDAAAPCAAHLLEHA